MSLPCLLPLISHARACTTQEADAATKAQIDSGFTTWPSHETSTDLNIVLDVPTAVQVNLVKSKCDWWDKYYGEIGRKKETERAAAER